MSFHHGRIFILLLLFVYLLSIGKTNIILAATGGENSDAFTLGSLFNNLKAGTIIALDPGYYIINNTLVNLVNITITPNNGEVELIIDTSIFAINCSNLVFKGPNLKILLNTDTATYNSSIYFVNVHINSSQAPKNLTIISGKINFSNMTIRKTTIVINQSTLSINLSMISNSLIFTRDSDTLTIDNSFLNYTRLILVNHKGKFTLCGNYIFYNFSKYYYRTKPLREEFLEIRYKLTTMPDTVTIIKNNYFDGMYERFSKIEVNYSKILGGFFIFSSNMFLGLNTLINITLLNSSLILNRMEIINNTIMSIDHIDPEILRIYSLENSSISVNNTVFAFNSQVFHSITIKYGYLFSFISINASLIYFPNILVFGNVFVSDSVMPFIKYSGTGILYHIQYFSPTPFQYVFRGKSYQSKIGNFFKYIANAGAELYDLNKDGLSDEQVIVSEYYDPYPICFYKPGYNWMLIDSDRFLIESNNISRIYRLGRDYYLVWFSFIQVFPNNSSDLVYGIGNYFHILLIDYFTVDGITIAVNTTYNMSLGPNLGNFSNNWLNISVPLYSTISVYLDKYYPIQVYSENNYTYNSVFNVITCTNTTFCKIKLVEKIMYPLPENTLTHFILLSSIIFILRFYKLRSRCRTRA